jgi:large subunit ribosomal protein L32
MTPHPKRKHSKGRRDRRRGQDTIQAVSLVQCSNCGELRPSHTVCPNCGHYQGREVFSVEKEKTK